MQPEQTITVVDLLILDEIRAGEDPLLGDDSDLERLARSGLIHRPDGRWEITAEGREFCRKRLEGVGQPSPGDSADQQVR